MYRVLDLFAGAGGMSLGFEQAGKFDVALAVEKHPFAQQTYKQNHNDTKMLDDILEIKDYNDFHQKYGCFDVVVGGPPCQGFSNANRQKNHIISQNNSLVKKYIEVIENLMPKAFVLENVRMLRSETHRFYRSISDLDDIKRLGIELRKESICLYEGFCPIVDIEEYLISREAIVDLLISEKQFDSLRIFLKSSYKKQNRKTVISKKGKSCIKAIELLIEERKTKPLGIKDISRNEIVRAISLNLNSRTDYMNYEQFEKKSLKAFIDYINGKTNFDDAESQMLAYINLQRLFLSFQELYNNNIIIDCLKIDDSGIYAEVQSFPVIQYINKKLGQYYKIDADVLNAAWYGAPQLRERFIAMGIRNDLAELSNLQPKLPEAYFKPEDYRKVSDAIRDLENISPSYTIDDPPINLTGESYIETPLTKYLRDSSELKNHITTETRETALRRFASLKPGQNFHDLDVSLIRSTYSRPDRTQNSIYLRLEYDKPSGTVTNVRKSMWIHPVFDRAVSIREAARLQTFPDSFVFVGSKDSQYQQVGNAVPPLMAKAVALKLAELLESCESFDSQEEAIDGYLHQRTTPSSDVQDTVKEYQSRNDRKEISA